MDAMIAIREEIRQVETGAWPQDDPLKNAPHTAEPARPATGTIPTRAGGCLPGQSPCAAPSTGRPWAAWTTSMATATCSAAAVPMSELA